MLYMRLGYVNFSRLNKCGSMHRFLSISMRANIHIGILCIPKINEHQIKASIILVRKLVLIKISIVLLEKNLRRFHMNTIQYIRTEY